MVSELPNSQENHNFIRYALFKKKLPNDVGRPKEAAMLSQVVLVGRAHVHLGLAMGTPSLSRCVSVHRKVCTFP